MPLIVVGTMLKIGLVQEEMRHWEIKLLVFSFHRLCNSTSYWRQKTEPWVIGVTSQLYRSQCQPPLVLLLLRSLLQECPAWSWKRNCWNTWKIVQHPVGDWLQINDENPKRKWNYFKTKATKINLENFTVKYCRWNHWSDWLRLACMPTMGTPFCEARHPCGHVVVSMESNVRLVFRVAWKSFHALATSHLHKES